MRGIWKDGQKNFSRDANVHWRGVEGRGFYKRPGEFNSWETCGAPSKKFWQRYVHRTGRTAFRESVPELLEHAHWELVGQYEEADLQLLNEIEEFYKDLHMFDNDDLLFDDDYGHSFHDIDRDEYEQDEDEFDDSYHWGLDDLYWDDELAVAQH